MRVTAIEGNTVVIDPPLSLGFRRRLRSGRPPARPGGGRRAAGALPRPQRHRRSGDRADQERRWLLGARLRGREHHARPRGEWNRRCGTRSATATSTTAHDYGGGGHGYGVSLGLHVTAHADREQRLRPPAPLDDGPDRGHPERVRLQLLGRPIPERGRRLDSVRHLAARALRQRQPVRGQHGAGGGRERLLGRHRPGQHLLPQPGRRPKGST